MKAAVVLIGLALLVNVVYAVVEARWWSAAIMVLVGAAGVALYRDARPK